MNFFYNDSKEKVHHESLPYSIRMLIVGESGSGKNDVTNASITRGWASQLREFIRFLEKFTSARIPVPDTRA